MFADLPDADLARICELVEVVRLPQGTELFTEGSPGDHAYVIKEGQIEIYKYSGGRNVQLAIRKSGEVIGEISLLEASPRSASGKALTDSVLLAISHQQLDRLLDTSPSAARTMLHTITSRLRSTEIMLQQSEKMAQLGTLTAGIAHELNNPAAAARRGSEQLIQEISRLQQVQLKLNAEPLELEQVKALGNLDAFARDRAAQPAELDSLARNDLEADLEDWLDNKDLENGWELAPQLASLGYRISELEQLAGKFPTSRLAVVIEWLVITYSIYSLLEEIGQGAGRISEIVKALKSYSYLDQAPVQSVDVREGLDNTLVMLRSKLKAGVSVKREYQADLPKVQAYASELNQVWTNIIDNAVDAMDGKGEITIRAHSQDSWVIVEIEDTGPGIPEEIRSRIFSPFFTTKPLGKGTGLGLNISYNIIRKHNSEIKVFSRPGRTRFEIWLPKNFENVKEGKVTLEAIRRNSDEQLKEILEKSHTIAVVGISDQSERPSFKVPAYLQKHGYRIIPVNPGIQEVLGEKSYPDLLSIPEKIDVVDIFRRSEAVPAIVDQALQIGAKVVWMQLGIVNQDAAVKAREAGLQAIEDTCMMATHQRLIG